MIYGYDENNEVVKFDMAMALSSINNRLTMGQCYMRWYPERKPPGQVEGL